jgi:hypothetical protein
MFVLQRLIAEGPGRGGSSQVICVKSLSCDYATLERLHRQLTNCNSLELRSIKCGIDGGSRLRIANDVDSYRVNGIR